MQMGRIGSRIKSLAGEVADMSRLLNQPRSEIVELIGTLMELNKELAQLEQQRQLQQVRQSEEVPHQSLSLTESYPGRRVTTVPATKEAPSVVTEPVSTEEATQPSLPRTILAGLAEPPSLLQEVREANALLESIVARLAEARTLTLAKQDSSGSAEPSVSDAVTSQSLGHPRKFCNERLAHDAHAWNDKGLPMWCLGLTYDMT